MCSRIAAQKTTIGAVTLLFSPSLQDSYFYYYCLCVMSMLGFALLQHLRIVFTR
jgi:hypothetical protein